MKKEFIIGVLFLVVWGFWFFGMRGHIGYWGETDFFQCGTEYWSRFVTQPGGWTTYLSNFLRQFYQWTFPGALIQTFTVVLLYLVARRIISGLGITRGRLLLACLPWVLVFILQVKGEIHLDESLKILTFFLLISGYLSLKQPGWRYGIFTLFLPLVLLLLGTEGMMALYLNLVVYEFWQGKQKGRWAMAGIWLLGIIIVPVMWRRWIYPMPAEHVFPLVTSGDYLKYLIYGYMLFLWIAVRISRLVPKDRHFVKMEWALLLAGIVAGTYFAYRPSAERYKRMEQAAAAGEWEKVLELGEAVNPGREEIFLINLALANRGELGEKLFDYPADWGIGGLYMPRENTYAVSVLGSELYYALKIPNEAIHWTFQAAVASPQGMDFRTLKRLVELNILKRDSLLTDKYLTILENTTGYGHWCRKQRLAWADPSAERVLPVDSVDFFIGGRPFVSDMARVLDAGRSKEMVSDYLLCGLLLQKDLSKFSRLIRMIYPSNQSDIPRIYQEAILVAITVGDEHLAAKNYQLDPDIRQKFQEYNDLYRICQKNKLEARQLMKEFRHTWWYYFHFTTPYPMDQQGHAVPIVYSL